VARRPRTTPAAPVSWRDGVHLSGSPIWCDARRRRDVCFVSSADRVGRAGHGQLIATPITLALLGAEAGHLAVPIHKPFTLGTTRLQLIPSGRGLGAAALHVDFGGRTVLYAGAIRTVHPVEPGEVRACDAVVVAAPIGEPHHKLLALSTIADRVAEWCTAQLAAGRAPVLVVDNVLDGLEVASRLVDEDMVVAASRGIRDAALRVRGHASVPAIRAPGREPTVVIRTETDRVKLAEGVKSATALVSLRALDPRKDGTLPGFDALYAWPFASTKKQLLEWIEQSRAKDIFITGACADTIAETLGPRARVLGPPRQMALFGS
jgi:putative mRNA 3-end processing factor